MIKIKIATDFTMTPGGRFIKEGKYSGEEFRKNLLLPKYRIAIHNKTKLIIDFDDCYGFATSFLEEAFGGLARELKDKEYLKNIDLISNDEPSLIELIKEYVEEADIKG